MVIQAKSDYLITNNVIIRNKIALTAYTEPERSLQRKKEKEMAKYSPNQNALFNQAITFATMAHGSQVRKGNQNIPYIFHPIDVANEVIYFSGLPNDEIEIASVLAILHDTIEDTIVTREDVSNQFGIEIAEGVQALTKNTDLPQAEQLAENLERIRAAKPLVQVVKLGDRNSNLKTFPAIWSREKIGEYLDSSLVIAEALGGSSMNLKARLLMQIAENRTRLSLYTPG